MKRHAIWLAWVFMMAAGNATPQERAIFRSGTSAVVIPVSVTRDNRPVKGLAVDDFVLTDKGVQQRLLGVSAVDYPVDVTLVMQLRLGLNAWWKQFRSDVAAIAKRLRPIDSLGVVISAAAIEVRSSQRTPGGQLPNIDQLTDDFSGINAWRSGSSTQVTYGDASVAQRPGPDGTWVGGGQAFDDAVALALMRPVPPDRRGVVVAFTDGDDQVSVLTTSVLVELAKRSGSVLFLVRQGPLPRLNEPADFLAQRGQLWQRPSDELADIARATGGEYQSRATAPSSYVPVFEQVFDGFRESYVLTYQPDGVLPGGWHDVVVTVPRQPRYTVRSRLGYVSDPRR